MNKNEKQNKKQKIIKNKRYVQAKISQSGSLNDFAKVNKYYIKTNTVFRLYKYFCIRIDEDILGINNLFFYENRKF